MSSRPTHSRFAGLSLAIAMVAALGCSQDAKPAHSEQPKPAAAADSPEQTNLPTFGLVQAPGYELVVQKCVLCHSARQFLQQRGDRQTWLGIIRWMQSDHGMWPLDPQDEDRIVDYLASHYAPERAGRRPPLRDDLMPPNPFSARRSEKASSK